MQDVPKKRRAERRGTRTREASEQKEKRERRRKKEERESKRADMHVTFFSKLRGATVVSR